MRFFHIITCNLLLSAKDCLLHFYQRIDQSLRLIENTVFEVQVPSTKPFVHVTFLDFCREYFKISADRLPIIKKLLQVFILQERIFEGVGTSFWEAPECYE